MNNTGKIFVTGATGYIGIWLVRALSSSGREVRALTRRAPPPPPPGFDWPDGGPLEHERVEVVRGDITDRESLARGMRGCSQVYHLAGFAKNWARRRQTFFDVNHLGMRNVLDVAEELGVQRVVWTSSLVTFGPNHPGQIADEDTPRISDRCFTDYEASKLVAEKEALKRAKDGFPVVIVNPTRVFGPGYLTEGNAASMVIDRYDRGALPFLLNFGKSLSNWVLVDDVVEGHILAMEKGRIGERYLLGGENTTLKEFFATIDRVSGKRHFQIPLMRFTPLVFAWLMKKRAEWFNVYPVITPGWVRNLSSDFAFSIEKAQRELGYRPTTLEEGIRKTYEWLPRARAEQPDGRLDGSIR